jgi:hypothetical protein
VLGANAPALKTSTHAIISSNPQLLTTRPDPTPGSRIDAAAAKRHANMSFVVDSDPVLISMALDSLQNLNANNYLIVFGPDGKQFLATPNGYSA